MNLLRNYASSLPSGALIAATLVAALAGTTAKAGDYGDSGAVISPATSRCSAYGAGFVDMGNGSCARVSGHVRVQFGTRNDLRDLWGAGGTSSATLRSDGSEIMPGVGASHQLRVRDGLQTLGPYQ